MFDGLRYRWRGDATELETIRALGQLYLAPGPLPRGAGGAALGRRAGCPTCPRRCSCRPTSPPPSARLFLDGHADGLEPVQALALFYDFKELTPIGADGDLMVRKLVRRLVDVDLLDQAAELLKYQADNRLDGVPRAQVATDLAADLPDGPQAGAGDPGDQRLAHHRPARRAERRAPADRGARLGAASAATTPPWRSSRRTPRKDAQDLRAEITWKQKDWAEAGPLFEKALGDRWKDPAPLSAEEEGKLLRAGVAYSLAGDDGGARPACSGQYQGFIDGAHNPEALRIALTGVPTAA